MFGLLEGVDRGWLPSIRMSILDRPRDLYSLIPDSSYSKMSLFLSFCSTPSGPTSDVAEDLNDAKEGCKGEGKVGNCKSDQRSLMIIVLISQGR